MKKVFGLAITMILFALLVTSNNGFAQKGNCKNQCNHNCAKFVDANGDGKCDNFVDANGDGLCDNCSGSGKCNGSGKGMGQGKGNCGNGCKLTGNASSKTSFTLNQNVPNPVVGKTKISFNLKEANLVKVVLSDKLGNIVKDIYEGNLSVGDHDIDLNVTGLNAGNYFYSVYVGGKVQTKQLVVVK